MVQNKYSGDILDASAHDTFAGAPSFTFGNRVRRALFGLAWLLLARWTPPQMRVWRVFLLNLFGAHVHRTANVRSSAQIWYPPNLAMEAFASLGPGVICYCVAPIRIGERAVTSQRAHLCTGTHDPDHPGFQLTAAPIEIGAHAWIAAEAYVGPGVFVGDGAVLGARGVTASDLKPWTIYAGNPARQLRKRLRPDETS